MIDDRDLKQNDFEIKFYEGILKKREDFIPALMALGDLYTQKKMYFQGLGVDQRLVQLRPDDPLILYNLACSYSLLNEIDKSLKIIKLAIDSGFRNFLYFEQDPDLENLRKDLRFQEYFSQFKKEKTPSEKMNNL